MRSCACATELTTLASALKGGAAVDSPVYTVLPDLQMPTRPAARKMGMASPAAQPQSSEDSYATKLQMARDAVKDGDFGYAKKILQAIYNDQTAPGADGKPKPARPFIVQQLALATYKVGEADPKSDEQALKGYSDAEALLRQLDVETTTDPETLGLWSAIHKQRADIATRSPDQQRLDLDIAIRAAERGFVIRRNSYNGTNLAFLLNVRASKSSGNDRIADNVVADRIRRQVVDITASALATLKDTTLQDEKYWIAATHAEALIALGDSSGDQLMRNAIASAPAPWMASTTQRQPDKVRRLLASAHS